VLHPAGLPLPQAGIGVGVGVGADACSHAEGVQEIAARLPVSHPLVGCVVVHVTVLVLVMPPKQPPELL